MKSLISLSILTIAISFTACLGPYFVMSDYEEETDFSVFKTYNILDHNHNFPKGANPIHMQRIERAIHNEVSLLGFEKADTPDLIVNWYIKIKDVQDVNIYRDYYSRWHYPAYIRVMNYKEGTLVIDVIDRKSKLVVWHGKTSDTVYEDMPNVEKKIQKAVNALVAQFAKDANVETTYALN